MRASVARAIRMAQSWRAEVTVSNTSLFSGGAPVVGARVSCYPLRLWPRHDQPAVISIYHIWAGVGAVPAAAAGRIRALFPPSRPEGSCRESGGHPLKPPARRALPSLRSPTGSRTLRRKPGKTICDPSEATLVMVRCPTGSVELSSRLDLSDARSTKRRLTADAIRDIVDHDKDLEVSQCKTMRLQLFYHKPWPYCA